MLLFRVLANGVVREYTKRELERHEQRIAEYNRRVLAIDATARQSCRAAYGLARTAFDTARVDRLLPYDSSGLTGMRSVTCRQLVR